MKSLKLISILGVFILVISQSQGSIFSSLTKLLTQEKTCDKAKWCSALLDKCNEPLINQVTCCYYCPLNSNLFFNHNKHN